MRRYESITLKEFCQFLQQLKITYFKHGTLAFWEMPLGIFGGPERTVSSCFWWTVGLSPLSSQSLSQLDIFWHDCHPLCMSSTKIGVFEDPDHVCLSCFLESDDGISSESLLSLAEVLG